MSDIIASLPRLLANPIGLGNYVTVSAPGGAFSGWEDVSVSLGMEDTAGSFDLTITETGAASAFTQGLAAGGFEAFASLLSDQTPVTISVNGTLVITGFIDKRTKSIGPEERTVTITGRSKTEDIIDSSEDHPTGLFKDSDCKQIAEKLCADYGINVETDVADLPVLERFHLEDGEPVYRAVQRVARLSGCNVSFTPEGNLTIWRNAGKRAAGSLIEGVNIESGSAEFDSSQQYKEIQVKGQSVGTDERYGKDASNISCTAEEPEMQRKRKLVVQLDADATLDLCKRRAKWEVARRWGKARSLSIETTDWKSPEGNLWEPNTIAFVQSTFLECNRPMLITAVTFSKGAEEGSNVQLTLEPPEAHEPEPQAQGAGDVGAGTEPVQQSGGGSTRSGTAGASRAPKRTSSRAVDGGAAKGGGYEPGAMTRTLNEIKITETTP